MGPPALKKNTPTPSLFSRSTRSIRETLYVASTWLDPSSYSRAERTARPSTLSHLAHLPVVQDADDDHSTDNISRRREQQPLQVGADRYRADQNGRNNFAAGHNAVGELTHAHHKSEYPNHGELPDGPLTRGDNPGHQRDQPSAYHSTPEDMRGRTLDGFCSQFHQLIRDSGT